MGRPELDATIDYYALLDVSARADQGEIKKQYKKLARIYHPDRNIGREREAVEKFQLLQTAHEVLSDPGKRATYDTTRGDKRRSTATYSRSNGTPHATPKPRHNRTATNANGFSKTSPKPSKPAFGYFTTREPPVSTRKPGSTPFKSPPRPKFTPKPQTAPKSAERDRAEAYFNRFRENSTSWQQSTKSSQKPTPLSTNQQRKEEARKAAGIQTPERKKTGPTRFGTTFDENSESEEDVFYSFSSNGGTFNETESWSNRRSAYSHVFNGVKEDVRSPMKSELRKPDTNGLASDGFAKQNGFASDGFKFTSQGTGTEDNKPTYQKSEPTKQNAFANDEFTFTMPKPTEPKPTEPKPTEPASEKKQTSTSQFIFGQESKSTTPPLDPNEIPKTPPPVEDRRFASAFSRLKVNTDQPNRSPTKPKDPIDMRQWKEKFEGMNPFMTPRSQKLSEDKSFWSSVPLKSSPNSARRAGRPRTRGTAHTNWEKPEAPSFPTSAGGEGVQFGVGTTNAPSVFPGVKINPLAQTTEDFILEFGAPSPDSPRKPKVPSTRVKPEGLSEDPPPSPRRVDPAIPPAQPPIPILNPPTPPKRLIPRPSSPKEFSFFVPPKSEMQTLAEEVQVYHGAYIQEGARFEESWKSYESTIQFHNEPAVRGYLELKGRLLQQRAQMEALHTLCLERWGAVSRFAGFG